jgi:ABC-type taurine transport system substrate-binding protein
MKEMGFEQLEPSIVYQDNKSCIEIASSFKQHSGLKHIELRDHFVREHVNTHKAIVLHKKATGEMTADLMTKQLPYPMFSKHRKSLGLLTS